MAATLCHIKSRELLPSPEPLEDEDAEARDESDEAELDPRADLISRLLEYQKYKEAADQLGQRPVVGRNVWGRGAADRGRGRRRRRPRARSRRSRRSRSTS